MAVDAKVSPLDQLQRAREEGWGYDGTQATELEVLHLLTALVLVTKPTTAVETGVYNGHGSKALVAGLEANEKGHLWAVENDPEITAQLEDVKLPRVTWVEADSIQWSGSPDCPDPIDFCWVDCCAEPSERVEVFSNLWPRMASGGLICVHDTYFYRSAGFLARLEEIAGPPSFVFPALNGIGAWQT